MVSVFVPDDTERINESQEVLEANLEHFDHPSEIWDSKSGRIILKDVSVQWLTSFADWQSFITLTFKNEPEKEVAPDVAKSKFLHLVRVLNTDAFGTNYRRRVGHSYFSYVLATEYQKREVIHFHALFARPVNFELLHRVWNSIAGFAWTEAIKSQSDVIEYIAKYVLKGGEIELHRAKRPDFAPREIPGWWPTPKLV